MTGFKPGEILKGWLEDQSIFVVLLDHNKGIFLKKGGGATVALHIDDSYLHLLYTV